MLGNWRLLACAQKKALTRRLTALRIEQRQICVE